MKHRLDPILAIAAALGVLRRCPCGMAMTFETENAMRIQSNGHFVVNIQP